MAHGPTAISVANTISCKHCDKELQVRIQRNSSSIEHGIDIPSIFEVGHAV